MFSKKAGLMQVKITDSKVYVRNAYDAENDIVVEWHKQYTSNSANQNIRPMFTYKGSKSLSFDEITASEFKIHSWQDSENPLFSLPSNTWWHLFANHGYLVPRVILTGHDKTPADYGSKWKDDKDRTYTLIGTTGNIITLAPTVTLNADGIEGKSTRCWNLKDVITKLTHVSGAVHTSEIVPTSSDVVQLYPLTYAVCGVDIVMDGNAVDSEGTYECDELVFSEMLACYDPASIPTSDLFPSINTKNAEIMCYMNNSFTIVEGSITYRASLDVKRPVYFGTTGGWGANQGIHLSPVGGYDSYCLFPRVRGHDAPKQRTSSSPNIFITNSQDCCYSEEKPADRGISYLYSPSRGCCAGFATGLSLVSGSSVDCRRVKTLGSGGLAMQWQQDQWKTYFQVVRGTALENGVLPAGAKLEVTSYYVHWNPDMNEGQVYWYKDGDNWIIYAHCQSAHESLGLNLPPYFEGKHVKTVDKTDGATLLSDTVSGGHLNVKYESAGETLLKNWIVLQTVDSASETV